MAKLEIELSIQGANTANKDVNAFADRLNKLKTNLSNANGASLSIEKQIKSLNTQLQNGSISTSQYDKQFNKLTADLNVARGVISSTQNQINSINSTIERGVTVMNDQGKAVKRLSAGHSDFARSVRGSNSISVEFSRIIQDAPYGIQGIANNLQQLSNNYVGYARNVREAALEQGKSISSFGIFKGAIGGLVSPLNLVTLGMSLATAGWVAYEKWTQKANKATNDAKKGTDDYISSLSQLRQVQVQGQANAQGELTSLRALWSIYRDTNQTLDTRKKAYAEMQSKWPSHFGNLTSEESQLEKNKAAYDRLTSSIIANATAMAASDKIKENQTRRLTNTEKQLDLENQLLKEQQILAKNIANAAGQRAAASAGVGAAGGQGLAALQEASEARQAAIRKQIADLDTDSELLKQRNKKLEDVYKANTITGLPDPQKPKGGGGGPTGDTAVSLAEWERQQIERIQAETVVKTSENQAKEYAVIESWMLKEVINAKGQAKLLETIDAEYKARRLAVTEKYVALEQEAYAKIAERERQDNEKRLAQVQSVTDKMNALANKDFRQNISYSKQGRESIERDLKGRLKAYEDFYQEIINLANGNQDIINKALSGLEGAITVTLKNAQSAKTPNNRYSGEDVSADLYKATQRFQTDFIGALQNITNQGKGLLAGLGDSFIHTFDDVFKNQLNQAFIDLSNGVKVDIKAIGGALSSMLGNLVSGLSKPTSGVGQGIGGALSGGASGFMLGGPIGAVIGGAIGALSGIFSASKARKQEELQKKQVALQEQQLQEQKRANALAYTSNIIGQMTRDGLVTAIDRDAFGNIVGKLDGKDITLSVDRTRASQRR